MNLQRIIYIFVHFDQMRIWMINKMIIRFISDRQSVESILSFNLKNKEFEAMLHIIKFYKC